MSRKFSLRGTQKLSKNSFVFEDQFTETNAHHFFKLLCLSVGLNLLLYYSWLILIAVQLAWDS